MENEATIGFEDIIEMPSQIAEANNITETTPAPAVDGDQKRPLSKKEKVATVFAVILLVILTAGVVMEPFCKTIEHCIISCSMSLFSMLGFIVIELALGRKRSFGLFYFIAMAVLAAITLISAIIEMVG